MGGAGAERQRIDGDAGFDRKHIAGNRADDRRRERTDDQAGDDRDGGDRENLQSIDARDRAAVGAEHFQRRQTRAIARKIARAPIADADARTPPRRQPDERPELPPPPDDTPLPRSAPPPVAVVTP